MFIDKKMFEKLADEIKKEDTPKTALPSGFIQMKEGHTYTFRMISIHPETRKSPFLTAYFHNIVTSNNVRRILVCPRTQHPGTYIQKCAVCNSIGALWKNNEQELYRKYKCKFHGYVLVHVIKDPTTPENDGHIKILRFGPQEHEWMKKEIFAGPDALREEAFDYGSKYNLIVSVGKKGEYKDYDYSFSRKLDRLDQPESELLIAEVEALNMDGLVWEETPENINKYYREVILEEDTPLDIPQSVPSIPKSKTVAPVAPVAPVVPATSMKNDEETEQLSNIAGMLNSTLDEDELDKLLNDLD